MHLRAGLLVLLLFVCCGCQAQAQAQPETDYYDYEDEDAAAPVYTPSPATTTTVDYRNLQRPSVYIPDQGRVDGEFYPLKSYGRVVERFLGIRYGHVGKGAARFQVATPPTPYYPYAHDASREPMPCPSFPDLDNVTLSERQNKDVHDCLTLNVFTPNSRAKLPVMVYVHGEFFFDGSAEEAKPDYLLRDDVVLVSVNYRLAPFGFLSTLTNEIPGNVALADVKMALEWVQRNVHLFGGDAGSVTVFGAAAGASLIHALALSRKAHGTFQRVILQSGTALNPFYVDEDPFAHAQDIARKANCPRWFSPYDINRCLAQLSTSEVIRAFVAHCQENEQKGVSHWGGAKLAVGDRLGFITNKTQFLNEEDVDRLSGKKRFDVAMIGGVAQHAGAYFISRIYSRLLEAQPRNNISTYLDIVLNYTTKADTHKRWKEIALRDIFTAEQIRSGNLQVLTFGLIELTNMILFKAPLLESAKHSRRHGVYLYNFEYRGQYRRYPFDRRQFGFNAGPSLSDENIYLFPYPVEVSNLNTNDTQMSEQMTSMWTTFARTGMPVLRNYFWPPADNLYGPYLKINERLEVDTYFTDGVLIPDFINEAAAAAKSNKSETATVSPTGRVRLPLNFGLFG